MGLLIPLGRVPNYKGYKFNVSSAISKVDPENGTVKNKLNLNVYPIYNVIVNPTWSEFWCIGINLSNNHTYHLIYYTISKNMWVIDLWSGQVSARILGKATLFSEEVNIRRDLSFGGVSPPNLTSGLVSPSSGTTDDTFTYQVTYTDADEDAPSFIRVYIDNIGYPMTIINGTYTGGALYQYATSSLNAGSFTYYFEASDDIDTIRIPTSGNYSGPTVMTANTAPSLTSGTVLPPSGNIDDTFTYEVTYTDANGDTPSYIQVYIDGTPHNMTKVSGTYTGGATYHYTTNSLSTGSHNYYFSASDHTDTDRLPKNGTYTGPIITENGANEDADGDGMSNMWENQYGLNPNNPSDASADPDGDGYTNLQECQAGTNPNDTTSHPTATQIAKVPINYIVVVVAAIVIVVSIFLVRRKL